ncbi:MAG: hypothetical protein A2162_01250 [Deltaproteobacteria bacterium RBG_13_52_11b]|nr:MAG: hypothetical protein A2162_01250 [Deltaproteobacteria bacterium RBG_13_52_11b]
MKGLAARKGVFVIEKRRDPRYKVELPLEYSPISKKEGYHGTIANANEGGILVYLPERLEIGDLFKIRIFFSKDLELNTIQAIAKVVWADSAARKSTGEYRYGLQLQSFYKGDLHKFRELLKEVGITHDR